MASSNNKFISKKVRKKTQSKKLPLELVEIYVDKLYAFVITLPKVHSNMILKIRAFLRHMASVCATKHSLKKEQTLVDLSEVTSSLILNSFLSARALPDMDLRGGQKSDFLIYFRDDVLILFKKPILSDEERYKFFFNLCVLALNVPEKLFFDWFSV